MTFLLTANTRFVSSLGPWSFAEVERILAAAQWLDDSVAETPSRIWWPAFLLVMLDTAEPPARLIALPRKAYDPARGELAVKTRRYRLHALAVRGLRALLKFTADELFPWPLDPRSSVAVVTRDRVNGRPRRSNKGPKEMLSYHLKDILYRADLPYVTENLFPRFLMTAQECPSLLDHVSLETPFRPRGGKSGLRVRAAELPDDRSAAPSASVDAIDERALELHRLAIPSATLLEFFEESYRERMQMFDCKETSQENYPATIAKFGWFLACEPTVMNLSDETVEAFMRWLKKRGLANATINGHRTRLLALWRHAWRKKLISEQPRDIEKLRVPKRIPEAWSTAEMAQLLSAAAETPGRICGIPAGDWWVALILLLYDTGLRIRAAMSLKVKHLDLVTGVVFVPAEVQKQNAEQSFGLHAETIEALKRILSNDHTQYIATRSRRWKSIEALERLLAQSREWLLPWPYDHCSDARARRLTLRFKEILKRAGLPHGRRDLFHRIRRTSGTAVADAVDEFAAKQHLGHSSIAVTKGYLDPRQMTKQSSAAEKIKRPEWRNIRGDDSENAAAG